MTIDFNSFQNSTSVAQQTSSSFTSAVKNLSSSVGTGVSGALNSISSKLGLSGLSGAGSVAGAFKTLGSTNIVAQLKDKMGVAPAIGSILPSMVPNNSAPPISMTYPKDLGKYYIQLFFFDHYQKNAISKRNPKDTFIVSLPIPENLQEQFGMSYGDKQLGVLGVLEAAGLNDDSISKMMAAPLTVAAEISNRIGDTTKNLATEKSGGSALAAARYGINGLGDPLGIGTALDRISGSILNPYQQLQFEGVNLREHTFSYTFSPNSSAEADTLKNIIRQLKMRMHPTLNGLVMNFPDQCKIKLSGGLDDFAYYKFQDCYLKTMSVNYAPSGTPAFFKDGAHPVEIKIDLTFGEIRPITRDFYTAGAGAGAGGGAGDLPTEIPSQITSPMSKINEKFSTVASPQTSVGNPFAGVKGYTGSDASVNNPGASIPGQR